MEWFFNAYGMTMHYRDQVAEMRAKMKVTGRNILNASFVGVYPGFPT